MKRLICCVAVALLFAPGVYSADSPRPNIVVILIDDLRWDDIGCMGHPFSKTPNIDRIAKEGILFQNAFATTPLCSPSRASFMTGQYVHTHGIIDNTERSAQSHRLVTFPKLLHDGGYETGFIGKWHMGNDDSRRPGFDYWLCMKGQGTTFDPELNQDGKSQKVSGYVTDILNDRAIGFVKREHKKPFLLYLAHKALHPELTQNADGSLSDPNASNYVPADRHKRAYGDDKIPRRRNVQDSLDGKPALQRKIGQLPPLGPKTGTTDDSIRDRLRMLLAVDEGIGMLLKSLEQTNQLNNTMIVFTSDHGYFYGEHGLSVERRLAYEEAIRIPLLIRYPTLVKAASTSAALVLNLDLAPTLLEVGGVPAPPNMEGRSMVPLLKGEPVNWRRSFLIEYFTDTVFPRVLKMGYQAVRTERWKFIHYQELEGMDELYDLQNDLYELKNVIREPSAQDALTNLRSERQRLLKSK